MRIPSGSPWGFSLDPPGGFPCDASVFLPSALNRKTLSGESGMVCQGRREEWALEQITRVSGSRWGGSPWAPGGPGASVEVWKYMFLWGHMGAVSTDVREAISDLDKKLLIFDLFVVEMQI